LDYYTDLSSFFLSPVKTVYWWMMANCCFMSSDASHNTYTVSFSGSFYFDILLLSANFSDNFKTHTN